MQKFSFKNNFDLHENEPVGRIVFHGFDTEQKVTWKLPNNLCFFLYVLLLV